jgi:hypothetical protein
MSKGMWEAVFAATMVALLVTMFVAGTVSAVP